MIDTMILALDPAFFAVPNGNLEFPSASHERPAWGGGFQVGLGYQLSDAWRLGASYKSEQWFEAYHFNSEDALGAPRELTLDISLPAIMSMGVAYQGWEATTVAIDVRHLDYEGTSQFGTPVAQQGQGWRNIAAVALGVHHRIGDRVSVQAGYLFNENPIQPSVAAFNIQSPAITQHSLSLGTTLSLTQSLSMSVGIVHAFRNRVSGPAPQPAGATVGMDVDVTSLLIGANLTF